MAYHKILEYLFYYVIQTTKKENDDGNKNRIPPAGYLIEIL